MYNMDHDACAVAPLFVSNSPHTWYWKPMIGKHAQDDAIKHIHVDHDVGMIVTI